MHSQDPMFPRTIYTIHLIDSNDECVDSLDYDDLEQLWEDWPEAKRSFEKSDLQWETQVDESDIQCSFARVRS